MLLRLSPLEMVRLLQAEFKAANRQPELAVTASIEYVFDEADRHSKRSEENYKLDRVTEFGLLAVEPRVERDYWILRIAFERPLGLLPQNRHGLTHRDLTLDEFEVALRACERKQITVRLDSETRAAKQHFTRWLAEMRTHHRSGRGRKVKHVSGHNRRIHGAKTKRPKRAKSRRKG